MIHECLGYSLGALVVLILAYFSTREPRLRLRSIDEITPFLYDPDQETVRHSFDRAEDGLWKRQKDRRVQWVRMKAFALSLMVAMENVRVIYGMARNERFGAKHHEMNYSPELVEKVNRVVMAAELYLEAARAARRRLYFAALSRFHWLPFMPVPELAAFQVINGIDLLHTYQTVGRTAQELIMVHGEGVAPIIAKIRVCFWT